MSFLMACLSFFSTDIIAVVESYCTSFYCERCDTFIPKILKMCPFCDDISVSSDTPASSLKNSSFEMFCFTYFFHDVITLLWPCNIICTNINDAEYMFFLGSPFVHFFEIFSWGTFQNVYVVLSRDATKSSTNFTLEFFTNQDTKIASCSNFVIRRHRKELKFIHITKTGGSSIETCAKNNHILWGSQHKEYGMWNKGQSPGGGIWHTFFTRQPEVLKENFDWFVVVRNPYERILSEVYCPYAGRDRPKRNMQDNTLALDQFNKYVQQKINNRHAQGDHYSEQYLYVEKGVFIIKFECLQTHFEQLMYLYCLPVCLNVHVNKTTQLRGETRFTIQDFSKETLNLIHTVYKKDFEYFQYAIQE